MSHRVLAVWLVLVLASLQSWQLGHRDGTAASLAVLGVACVKVRLIGQHFMELKGAHASLRLLLDGYVLLLAATLAGFYLAA